MAAIKEIATQAQSGAFDTARRLVKTQEDVLGAFEDYQGSVLKDIRTPWAAVKANYGLVKQLASIQSDLALEWAAVSRGWPSRAFGRQPSPRRPELSPVAR